MSLAKTLFVMLAIAATSFTQAQPANPYDLVITEIMADPSPVVGLPNAEYIEIKNVSATSFVLTGWRLSDATGTATINTPFVLQPDSIVILCSASNVASFATHGRTIGVSSFPSLDNDGELLTLRSPQNKVIHAVTYSKEWYGNEVKKEGGWSLEMIDTKNPCGGKSNWKESVNTLGGTPGKINSIAGANTDDTPPQLKRSYAIDSVTLVLIFDEPLDSNSAARSTNYVVTGNTIVQAMPIAPLFQSVQLTLANPLQKGRLNTITVSHVSDCKGNEIGAYNSTKLGLAQVAASNDIVINEILFNPKPGGYDYVEFYNRSNYVIDAATLYVANRSSSGVVGSLKKIAEEPLSLFPGDYLVITEDKIALEKQYLVKNGDAVRTLSALPSFADDKGTVVLLNNAGVVIDEVTYDAKWHFGLIDDADGVALEKVDPSAPSQNSASWHSASAVAGYGTPTSVNSQLNKPASIHAAIAVSPAVFSPDNDGVDDMAIIQYNVEKSGYIANVLVFDAAGRLVRHLVKNSLLGLKGFWQWDGLGENRTKLPIGTYVVYTELFDLNGKKISFKKPVVLARRLN